MDIVEAYVQHVVQRVQDDLGDDLEAFAARCPTLPARLDALGE